MAEDIICALIDELADLKSDTMDFHIMPTHYYISAEDFKKLSVPKLIGKPLFKDMCLGMKHIIREGPLAITCIK